jgi:hypothetical protein
MAKAHRRQARRAGAATVSDVAAERARELVGAAPEELLDRLGALGGETPGGSAALVEALGGIRSEAAGRALATVAARAPGKELRKAARRGLHRLRAVGIAVEVPEPVEEPVGAAPGRQPRLTDAFASAPDGIGSRALWLAVEPPGGGLDVFWMVLNDVVGMKDCTFRETTRRRFNELLRDWGERSEMSAVELPGDYALALVSEALKLNAESGFTVPTDFQIHRRLLGELPPPPEDALIHRDISRGQALLLPNLLEESAELLEEEEMKGWFFGYDESIERARELQRIRESRIVLTAEPREQREGRVIDTAIAELFSPPQRRAIRRRLEEIAYVFWKTGRERSARRAVAAAFALGDGSLSRHPLARAMAERSLEFALEVDRAGVDPATVRRSAYDPID